MLLQLSAAVPRRYACATTLRSSYNTLTSIVQCLIQSYAHVPPLRREGEKDHAGWKYALHRVPS